MRAMLLHSSESIHSMLQEVCVSWTALRTLKIHPLPWCTPLIYSNVFLYLHILATARSESVQHMPTAQLAAAYLARWSSLRMHEREQAARGETDLWRAAGGGRASKRTRRYRACQCAGQS